MHAGNIPEELGKLTALEDLSLRNNKLVGEQPSTLVLDSTRCVLPTVGGEGSTEIE